MDDDLRVRDAVAGDAGGICAIYNEAIAERSSTFETAPGSLRQALARRAGRRAAAVA
jgi:L-amino acid N-acyltransferase YncA